MFDPSWFFHCSQRFWSHTDGLRVSREQFMMALADIEALMIRATYSTRMLQTL